MLEELVSMNISGNCVAVIVLCSFSEQYVPKSRNIIHVSSIQVCFKVAVYPWAFIKSFECPFIFFEKVITPVLKNEKFTYVFV